MRPISIFYVNKDEMVLERSIPHITNNMNTIYSQDKRINDFLFRRRGVQKSFCPCYCKTLKRVSFFTMNRLSSVMRERLMTTDFKAQTVVKFFSCCMVSKQILEKCYELGHIHKGRVFYIYIYGIYNFHTYTCVQIHHKPQNGIRYYLLT